MEIFTIGHSNVPAERIVALLRQHAIAVVVDVRSVPYSRHNPQFNRQAWKRTLEEAGIEYLLMGDQLGGRPKAAPPLSPTPAPSPSKGGEGAASKERWEQAIGRLLEVAAGQRMALLCAEEDPQRCHRGLVITPALLDRGVTVWHIRGDGRLERAEREVSGRQLPLL